MQNDSLKVSVLLPVYKTPLQWVKIAVGSLMEQTIQKFQLVIVDDNNPPGELTDYLYTLPLKRCCIEVVRTPENKGIAAALNLGLECCTGDIVVRMDSDDVAHPDLLKKQLAFFTTNPGAVICGVQIRLFNEEREWYVRHPLRVTKEIAKKNTGFWFVNHPGVGFRKNVILSLGGYGNTPAHLAEDYALWIKLLCLGIVIYNLEDVLIAYRCHEKSFTGLQDRQSDEWKDFLISQKQLLYD